jgi:hypothetical protein
MLHLLCRAPPAVTGLRLKTKGCLEQSLLVGHGDGLEIGLPVGELRAMRVEQAEFRVRAVIYTPDRMSLTLDGA